MLRFGPEGGPVVVAALPLLEEANRTRAFAVAILRALAERGIAGALPELPGTGESLVPLGTLSLLRISEGYEGAVDHLLYLGHRPYGFAIRSGALVDHCGLLSGRYHFAPQPGPDLLREWKRVRQASEPAKPLSDLWYFDPDLPPEAPDPPVEIAGNMVSTDLLTGLSVYEPWTAADGGPVRTVRLYSDPRPADRHVPGDPLWRSVEPGSDPALAALLADDIAAWVRACEG